MVLSSGRCGRALVAAGAGVGVCALAVSPAQGVVEWADWVAATANFPSTVSVGQFGGAFTGVSITYNGASLTTQVSGGTNYWSPSAPYVGGPVTNPPPTVDCVVLNDFTSMHSVTFGSAVTNPVMAIAGLGYDNGPPESPVPVTWSFSETFTLLNSGPGFFGSGSVLQANATTLQGINGHGVIQFQGTFTTLSWTTSPGEDESVFTFGLIPAPGVLPLGAIGLAFAGRRRRR